MQSKPTRGSKWNRNQRHLLASSQVLFLFDAYFLLLIKCPPGLDEAATQTQPVKGADTITIYFMEGNVNRSDMMEQQMDRYKSVREVRVAHGDPNSFVEQAFGEYVQEGKRTVDRYKIYLPADHCYAIATQPYSKNYLFLIPDIKPQEEALVPEAQGGENQVIVDLENYEMSQKNIQALEMELAYTTEVLERGYQAIEGQEDRRMDGQQTGKEEDGTMAGQHTEKEEDGTMAGQQMRGEDDSDCDLLIKRRIMPPILVFSTNKSSFTSKKGRWLTRYIEASRGMGVDGFGSN